MTGKPVPHDHAASLRAGPVEVPLLAPAAPAAIAAVPGGIRHQALGPDLKPVLNPDGTPKIAVATAGHRCIRHADQSERKDLHQRPA
jgi:hypothetical protein